MTTNEKLDAINGILGGEEVLWGNVEQCADDIEMILHELSLVCPNGGLLAADDAWAERFGERSSSLTADEIRDLDEDELRIWVAIKAYELRALWEGEGIGVGDVMARLVPRGERYRALMLQTGS